MRCPILLTATSAALFLSAPLSAQTTQTGHTAQTAQTAQISPKALTDADYTKLGKQYTVWLFGGRADSIAAHMVPQSKEAVGGADGILKQRAQIAEKAGTELGILQEKMTRRRGNPQFWHEAMFDKMDEPVVLRWVMNPEGQIVGVGLGPKSSSPEPDPPAAN